MSELPRSIVLGGRRYPTWTLSARVRELLKNLGQVDAHIEHLQQRLAIHSSARSVYQQRLRDALPQTSTLESRYFWQTAPPQWARQELPTRETHVSLEALGAADHYRAGDQVLVYVKGYGAVGWGCVEKAPGASGHAIAWRYQVSTLKSALPARRLKEFGVRHPNRASQELPSSSNISDLLAALEDQPGFRPDQL